MAFIKKEPKEIRPDDAKMPPHGRVRPLRASLMAFATMAAVGSVLLVALTPMFSAKELYEMHKPAAMLYEVQPHNGQGMTPGQHEIYGLAGKAFNDADYSVAAAEFDRLTDGTPMEHLPDEVVFYSAIAMQRAGRGQEATERLQYLHSKTLSHYWEDAAWELALEELAAGNRQKSRTLLAELASRDGYFALRAKQLIGDIDRKKWR